MTEPLILTMLRAKQADVEQHIDGLNARLANARRDLLHLAATIKLFDPAAADDTPALGYHGSTKALKRSELFDRCKTALTASSEPLSTRELAQHVITAEGWDYEDRDLRLTVAHRIGCMMGRFERRHVVLNAGTKSGATLWRLS